MKLCEKRVYTVLVKNSWNHISGVWCCPILDGMTPRMTVPLFVLVDCSRFWWCLERKTSGILKVLANGILYLYMCPLTDVACGVKWVVGMSTKPCTIRYIIMTLYWALRSCSGAQFSSFSIGVTLVVCLKSLYTNRADRLCTASSLFMFSLVWGSQMVQAYSMSGLTNVW